LLRLPFGIIALLLAVVFIFGGVVVARDIGAAGLLPPAEAEGSSVWLLFPVVGTILAGFGLSQLYQFFLIGDDSDEDIGLWRQMDPKSRGILLTKKQQANDWVSRMALAIGLVSLLIIAAQMPEAIWKGLFELRAEPWVALLLVALLVWRIWKALQGNQGWSQKNGRGRSWFSEDTWTFRFGVGSLGLFIMLNIMAVYGIAQGINYYVEGYTWLSFFFISASIMLIGMLIKERRTIRHEIGRAFRPAVLRLTREVEGRTIILNGRLEVRPSSNVRDGWQGRLCALEGEDYPVQLQEKKFLAEVNGVSRGKTVQTFSVSFKPEQVGSGADADVIWMLTLSNPQEKHEQISLVLPTEVVYVEEYPVAD